MVVFCCIIIVFSILKIIIKLYNKKIYIYLLLNNKILSKKRK